MNHLSQINNTKKLKERQEWQHVTLNKKKFLKIVEDVPQTYFKMGNNARIIIGRKCFLKNPLKGR